MHLILQPPPAAWKRVAKRKLNAAMKVAWLEIAKEWVRKYAPYHFTRSGYVKYHYRSRSRKYEERKRRQKGHTRPNVWSGKTEANTKRARVRATSKMGKATFRAPGRQSKELTTVVDSEYRHLSQIGVRTINRLLKGL